MVKRPSRVITEPAGVSMANQASPRMAKSSGLPVCFNPPDFVERYVEPGETKETESLPRPETTSSNLISVARKPTVPAFATLSAMVLRRFSSATWAEIAT